jgi:branched-chain amino acid transport system ATP-binding protein
MVVIGGMRSFLGPALGALFYILFREFLSIYTDNWLFWFGLLFVGFIVFSPEGLVGIWEAAAPLPPAEESAAMSRRRSTKACRCPPSCGRESSPGAVLEATGPRKNFGGIKAVDGVDLKVHAGAVHALIGPNGAGKTTAFNLISGMFPPTRQVKLLANASARALARPHHPAGLARSFQITNLFKGLTIDENLRLSLQARHPGRFNIWRDADSFPEVTPRPRS